MEKILEDRKRAREVLTSQIDKDNKHDFEECLEGDCIHQTTEIQGWILIAIIIGIIIVYLKNR